MGLIVPVSALKAAHCLLLILSDETETIAAPDGEPPINPSVAISGTTGMALRFKREAIILHKTI